MLLVRSGNALRQLTRRNFHRSCNVLQEVDSGVIAAVTLKRKYTKKPKQVDVNSALQDTSRLMSHARYDQSMNEDVVVSRFPKKTDKSFTGDLERNVFSKDVRLAIDKETKKSPERKPIPKLKAYNKTETLSKRHSKFNKTETLAKINNFYGKSPRSRTTPFRRVEERPNTSLLHLETLDVNQTEVKQLEKLNNSKIPQLAHNLDKALFSPGVHFLQDPRTRVYNFPPFLKKIIDYKDFNFDAIAPFTTVSKDSILLELTKKHKKKYYSSTSSMTAVMIQFYFLLNNYPFAQTDRFDFDPMNGFLVLKPAMLIIQKRENGLYSIESDKSIDNEILLSAMGHCLEALLTTEETEFKEKYELVDGIKQERQQDVSAYNYSTYGNFVMRSQLDCIDPRLPGNGTFDLKTRASCSVRYNSRDPTIAQNKYQIWKLNGEYESFEKEFKDLVRTGALLKYAYQARIGQMDGIYVAYHNVNSFFGFQYLPLETLDEIFYGNSHEQKFRISLTDTQLLESIRNTDGLSSKFAETQFKMTLSIWEKLLEIIKKDITDLSYRLIVKSERINGETKLCVYALPIKKEDIKTIQRFSSNYETSFKHGLDKEQLGANLLSHHSNLCEFNEKIVEQNDIFVYYVELDLHEINGKTIKTSVPVYPRDITTDWKIKYKINKVTMDLESDIKTQKDKLIKLLHSASESIVPLEFQEGKTKHLKLADKEIDTLPREKAISIYSLVGAERDAHWKDKDENPVVYVPKR